MTLNLGHAILILGLLHFGFTHGFAWWLQLLFLLPLATWGIHGFSEERKALLLAQVEYYNAKAFYYRNTGDKKP